MNFAKNLLGKYGWKEGDGLGKNNDGINTALKPNYKFDKGGLGHNKADELNNHWWENVYNSAAQNMAVTTDALGSVAMERKTDKAVEITTRNYTLSATADTYYKGQFLKTSTLINASEEVRDVKPRARRAAGDSDSDSDDEAVAAFLGDAVRMNPFKVVADAELLRACNGRTAHKGARHGINMSGKLARIEAQERELLAKMNLAQPQPEAVEPPPAEWTAVKKRKRSHKDKSTASDDAAPTSSVESTLFQHEYQSGSKRKDKKKRRTESELSEAMAAISTADREKPAIVSDENPELTKSKKKKKRKTEHAEEAAEAIAEENGSKKKSRKRKCSDVEMDDAPTIPEETAAVAELPKKSKKSKKSREQENIAPVGPEAFLKSAEPEQSESDRQNAKQERKRLRRLQRLARENDGVTE